MFQVEQIGAASTYLPQVLSLHAAFKATLGPFPRGAFEEHAEKKQILVALAPDGAVAGYLLYRVAKSRAALTHLTSAERFRGHGIATMLLDRLKHDTIHLLGISLWCRRDYDLSGMWSRFGFTVRHTKAGRGSNGALLDYWWFGHHHDDLFSLAAEKDGEGARVVAAIDANVFFDLTLDGRPHGDDTQTLEATWLQDSLELCITPELYNEINRAASEDDRRRARGAAQGFRELRVDEARVKALERELRPIFDDAILDRDESDMRQVAYSIASEVPFFVTRDARILNQVDHILDRYGVRVIHPVDLVVRFDSLRREAEYRPVRLEGSRWRGRRVNEADIEILRSTFRAPNCERVRDFDSILRHHLAHPETSACRIAVDDTNKPTVLLVEATDSAGSRNIALLRHTSHPLAGTLVRHMLHAAVLDLGRRDSALILVSDLGLSSESITALRELGFIAGEGRWWKLNLTGVVTIDDVMAAIQKSGLPAPLKLQLAASVASVQLSAEAVSHCETVLAPAKLAVSDVACFVVSIRPDWADHFFDIPVGGQTLMDLDEKLHLGIEGAYYCSGRNQHLVVPARILWYVSRGRSGRGVMEVKACSQLVEIANGKPKDVYRRFKHLGVYAWKHVFESVGKNLEKSLLAFRFTRTERFSRPVTLTELKSLGVPQPVNPRRISTDQFNAIYKLGMNLC